MKGVSVYGVFETLVPVYQRYCKWVYHRTGPKAGLKWYKRRVWKKTSRFKKVIRMDTRYEFSGSGKDLYRAIIEARKRVPFDYIEIGADEFLEHPERYGKRGEWVEWQVVS